MNPHSKEGHNKFQWYITNSQAHLFSKKFRFGSSQSHHDRASVIAHLYSRNVTNESSPHKRIACQRKILPWKNAREPQLEGKNSLSNLWDIRLAHSSLADFSKVLFYSVLSDREVISLGLSRKVNNSLPQKAFLINHSFHSSFSVLNGGHRHLLARHKTRFYYSQTRPKHKNRPDHRKRTEQPRPLAYIHLGAPQNNPVPVKTIPNQALSYISFGLVDVNAFWEFGTALNKAAKIVHTPVSTPLQIFYNCSLKSSLPELYIKFITNREHAVANKP